MKFKYVAISDGKNILSYPENEKDWLESKPHTKNWIVIYSHTPITKEWNVSNNPEKENLSA
jgi:hypothetical protein